MQKKTLIMFAITTVCAVATSANAVEFSPYLSAKTGIGITHRDHMGDLSSPGGVVISGAFGTSIKTDSVNLRAELEYGFGNFTSTYTSTLYSGTASIFSASSEYELAANSYMANFYIDFLENYKIKPFIGVSLGYSSTEETLENSIVDLTGVTLTDPTMKYSDNGFIYGLNAGFGFDITDELSGEFGTRYTQTKIAGFALDTFSATLGLRYHF